MFHITALPQNLCSENVPHHLLDLTCRYAVIWDCFHSGCNLPVHTSRSGMGQNDSWDMYEHHHKLVRKCWLLDSYGCHHPIVAHAHHTLSATADKSENRLNIHLWSRSIVSLLLCLTYYIR